MRLHTNMADATAIAALPAAERLNPLVGLSDDKLVPLPGRVGEFSDQACLVFGKP